MTESDHKKVLSIHTPQECVHSQEKLQQYRQIATIITSTEEAKRGA